MSHFHNNALIGASGGQGGGPYKIERSLRFNDDDSAYLNRTPSSAGNRRTFTFSAWVKKSKTSGNTTIFSAGSDGSNRSHILLNGTDHTLRYFNINSGSLNVNVASSAFLRDHSAWYHIVIAADTSQSTASDRIKIYLNGVQITSFSSSTYPSQNADLQQNATVAHNIGKGISNAEHFDGYLADVHFVDGAQLAASDFGEYDDNNIWQPKEFAGSYGTTVAAGYTGTVPTSTTDVAPAGSYQNGIATAAVLFGGTILTNGQNHIRQDGGGIEWSSAIPLTSGDVAGAQCLYFNNTSTHAIEFKIDGNWVTGPIKREHCYRFDARSGTN